MSVALSKTWVKPEEDDTDQTILDAVQANATLGNDHTHNGTDSQRISVVTQAIAAGVYSGPTNGIYSYTATLTNSLQVDNVSIQAKLTSNGEYIFPTIFKASATTVTIEINEDVAITLILSS